MAQPGDRGERLMKDLAALSATPLTPNGYTAGVSSRNVAEVLRGLADMLDRKEAIADVVKLIGAARKEDFTSHTLIVRFTAKQDEAVPNAGRNNPAPPPGAWTVQDDNGVYTHGYASNRVRPGYLDTPFTDEAAALWWQSEAAKEYLKLRDSI